MSNAVRQIIEAATRPHGSGLTTQDSLSSSGVTPAGRSIGAILVDKGRISPEQAERVLRMQKENGLRFGEAAVLLGLLSEDDIRQALSHQFDYPYLSPDDNSLSKELVAAYRPFSPAVENLRALRSQLMLRWFDAQADRKTLAIVSAGAGEGRSHIAANLGVVFSQLGERTLVIDADLRKPRMHGLFKLPNHSGLADVLSGRTGLNAVVKIPTLLGLSVLPAGTPPPNPQELLGREAFSELLRNAAMNFDIVILDTPTGGDSADAQIIASRAKAAVLVARKHRSSQKAACALAAGLRELGTTVVGSVLNEG